MLRLEFNPILGRPLRVDDLDTLGIATQTLAETAIRDGRHEEALALVDYYFREMRIMHDIMVTWLADIGRYLLARETGYADAAPLATTLVQTWRTFPVGEAPRERCKEAIAEGDKAAAILWLEKMRLEFKNPHDILVAWVQDLLATIATRWGEEAVLECILETHDRIWGARYERWDQMTPHEKLALTVEGMRGGHFSGPQRRGDVLLIDQGDRYKMIMDPCGSGGVLRRGDPETGRPPHPAGEEGVNRQPHLWTWQKTGLHWYCVHCPIVKEWLSGRRRGRLLRPLDHALDPDAPCTWYVYKDENRTRAYHYPRTGTPVPPNAPDFGEDWSREYPGGS
ncbi:MAG: hypothetical protein D6775_03240 [Caldilineae bacterium]|nr:MAG: hypothetical protein D6775_03240 [Caldilineae bacterium]